MSGVDVTERVREALAEADEPLTPGQIQRHVAGEGLDVATGAIRQACRDLAEDGAAESVGEAGRQKYRLTE